MPAAQGRPATYDRTSQHRRAMMAKVHVAKKQLRMVDDDYRQLLMDTVGVTSAADCSNHQLARVVEALSAKGFKPTLGAVGGGRAPRSRRAADNPMANKARALWISLHHLGVIDNPSEKALEGFAARQLKVDRMAWADQSQGYKLIEALKAMGERHGWAQTGLRSEPLEPEMLQRNLVGAIVAKLKAKGIVPRQWTLPEVAFKLLGENPGGHFHRWTIEQLLPIAAGLGKKLRAAGGAE